MYLNVKLGQSGGNTQEGSAVHGGQQIESQEHLCSTQHQSACNSKIAPKLSLKERVMQ